MANEAGSRRRPLAAVGAILATRPEAMVDAEICRMAAFRLRETSNRLATLAARAEPSLREHLTELCKRLQQDERTLLEWAARPPAS